MTSFSVSDAATTGFRIVREHPKAVAIWAALQLMLSLGSSVVMVTFGAPLTTLGTFGANASRDPAVAMAEFQQLAPLFAFFLIFALVFYPILYAAMNRAVLRPEEEGFGYLRVGADELRQFGLMILLIAVGIAAYIAVIVAMLIAVVPLGLMTAASRGAGAAGPTFAVGILTLLLILAAVALWVFVWVRLSLASALTFATRKVNLFGSWTLTRGLFWPMFAAYLVALILVIVVMVLTGVISVALAAVTGGAASLTSAANLSSLSAFVTPTRLVGLVVSSLAYALVWPVML
jgi:hypothetical protein